MSVDEKIFQQLHTSIRRARKAWGTSDVQVHVDAIKELVAKLEELSSKSSTASSPRKREPGPQPARGHHHPSPSSGLRGNLKEIPPLQRAFRMASSDNGSVRSAPPASNSVRTLDSPAPSQQRRRFQQAQDPEEYENKAFVSKAYDENSSSNEASSHRASPSVPRGKGAAAPPPLSCVRPQRRPASKVVPAAQPTRASRLASGAVKSARPSGAWPMRTAIVKTLNVTPRTRMQTLIAKFREMDCDHDQLITQYEFLEKMKKEGEDQQTAMQLFEEIDKSGSGTISLAELDRYAVDSTIDFIHKKFKTMDTDGSRKLDKVEWNQYMTHEGVPRGKQNKLWRELDRDRNGFVSLREFDDWIHSLKTSSKSIEAVIGLGR